MYRIIATDVGPRTSDPLDNFVNLWYISSSFGCKVSEVLKSFRASIWRYSSFSKAINGTTPESHRGSGDVIVL